ncbi:MAG: bifunctional glycosyltransferase family 2/GtrA family protein [Propionibacteriaceae bacterium]|jgi:putative flippase GtrA|nr:bifunctional glycosyltransferase family 2/GtrA family protein [Propionibacteriaceae bacterium]
MTEAAVIIPSLEPDEHLIEVLGELRREGMTRIVVVNDGSSEDYDPIFAAAEAAGASVARHPVNRGKGAALRTGIEFATELWPDTPGYVTADSDGQHTAADIHRVCEALAEHPDSLILGVRDFSGDDVPLRSSFGNRLTSLVFLLESGIRCQDTQTGLRGLPLAQKDRFLAVPGDRFEYEMNVLMDAAKADIPFVEVPIATIYRDENSHSHFSPVRDGVRIYFNIVKFAGSALTSSATDLLLFLLLAHLVLNGLPHSVAIATIIARLVSGVVNYLLNRKVVFDDDQSTRQTAPKYLVLFLCVMLTSALVTQALSVLPIPLVVIKIVVDLTLFVANYYIQRHFIFKKNSAATSEECTASEKPRVASLRKR